MQNDFANLSLMVEACGLSVELLPDNLIKSNADFDMLEYAYVNDKSARKYLKEARRIIEYYGACDKIFEDYKSI